MITSFFHRHKALAVPVVIVLISLFVGAYLIAHTYIAHGTTTYYWDYSYSCVDGGDVGLCTPTQNGDNCSGSCDAAHVGTYCNRFHCTGASYACFGQYDNFVCMASTSCTPDTSCAATTCDTTTCTATAADCSTYSIQGQKNCAPPPTTCADIGMLGSPYPSGCYAPPPPTTCADIGMLGSPYPSGCYAPPPPPPPPPSTPTATLSASATTVASGGSVNLTWSSSDTTSCTVVSSGPAFATGGATSGGPKSTGALVSDTTYTLNCNGPDGPASDSKTIRVTGGACTGTGTIGTTITPSTRVQQGTNVTIAWTDTDATGATCTVTNATTGATIATSPIAACSTSGNTTLTSVQNQTAVTITCGGTTKTVVVNVVPKFKEF